jgi:hypothetical protein
MTLRKKDQALLDALAPGDRRPWEDALASGAVYIDENGTVMERAEFLRELKPLPRDDSGRIVITKYQARIAGDTALVVHVDDEFESYHGIPLRAQYLTSETWRHENGAWKLMLVHVYVERKDPPAITLPVAQLNEYTGTFHAGTNLVNVISLRDGHLYEQTPKGPARPLFVEVKDVLFVPGQQRDRMIFRRNANGQVDAYIDRREGEDIVWHRQ